MPIRGREPLAPPAAFKEEQAPAPCGQEYLL